MCLIKVNDQTPLQTRYPRWVIGDGIPVMIGALKIPCSERQVKHQ